MRSYELTRDGFVLLVMGWTGPKALEFKVRYIQAFNAMEKELSDRREIAAFHRDLARIVAVLHPHQLRTLEALNGLSADSTGVTHVTIADLAKITGLSEENTCRHVALLCLLGNVSVYAEKTTDPRVRTMLSGPTPKNRSLQ